MTVTHLETFVSVNGPRCTCVTMCSSMSYPRLNVGASRRGVVPSPRLLIHFVGVHAQCTWQVIHGFAQLCRIGKTEAVESVEGVDRWIAQRPSRVASTAPKRGALRVEREESVLVPVIVVVDDVVGQGRPFGRE